MLSKKYPGLNGRQVTVRVGKNVRVSRTAAFGSGVVLNDDVVIGPQSQIGAGSKLWNTTVGKQTVIGERARIRNCTIAHKVTIGRRFTFVEFYDGDTGSIGAGVVIGDCVEVKGRVAISKDVHIGNETRIVLYSLSGSLVIGSEVRIGSRCRIDDAELDEYVKIGDEVLLNTASIGFAVAIGAGAQVNGHIGANTSIGPNSIVDETARVGEWCTIGGDVIIRNTVCIPDHWLLPDGAIVNPGPNSIPVVIHTTAPPRV